MQTTITRPLAAIPSVRALLLLFLLTVAGPASLGAHVRIVLSDGQQPRWEAMPVAYAINYEGSAQIPNDSEFMALESAFRTWENAPDAEVSFDYLGLTFTGLGADGLNTITFAEEPGLLGSSTIAATLNYYTMSGEDVVIAESDIVFNPTLDFSTSAEFKTFDIESVAIHEIGHMLGLGHSPIVSSLMSPFGTRGAVHRRALAVDDRMGIREIYPSTPTETTLPTGSVTGRITRNGSSVFAAHVVALDNEGTSFASVLSAKDGTFTFNFLPVGTYTFYAEPLRGTVTPANLSAYFSSANTSFGVTFLGGLLTADGATLVDVEAETVTAGVDIETLPQGTLGFRLTEPFNGVYFDRGSEGAFVLGGHQIDSSVSYTPSAAALRLDDRSQGGYLHANAPSSTNFTLRVSLDAPIGPKTILGEKGDTRSIMTGAVIVTPPSPQVESLSPASGPNSGGTSVQIEGLNFRSGIRVEFGGIPATSVEVLNPSLLQVTVPPNTAGPANIVLINEDGTSGVLDDGFVYTAASPTVTTVFPGAAPPGTIVLIGGTGFGNVYKNVLVTFNGVPGRVVFLTNTQIFAVVPYGASTGELKVTVFGAVGSGGTFIVNSAPLVNPAPDEAQMMNVALGEPLFFFDFGVDDDIDFVELPFDFSLFGDTFFEGEWIAVSQNGWMSMEPSVTAEWVNPDLPAATVERPSGSIGIVAEALIAPFFDDLIFGDNGRVRTLVSGTAPSRVFVVEWSNVSVSNEFGLDLGADLTFQVQMYESSNDLRFVYGPMSGERSNGSHATIGIQNYSRTEAEQISYNQPVIGEGIAITFRFDNGTYTIEGDPTPPESPDVTDGGDRTASQTELIASWSTSTGQVESYEYAIGTTPGGTDVRDFTSVFANSVVATGLSLQNASTYYFTVRARSSAGVAGLSGASDGILVDTAFVPTRLTFPSIIHGDGAFAGIAVMAEDDTDVVLRALNPDGTLTTGLGIVNPAVVSVDGATQWAELIHETFGLTEFDGWVELEASAPSIRAYASMGANDLLWVDGVGAAPASTDFYLVHAPATATLVNPGAAPVSATITPLGGGNPEVIEIPARSRRTTELARAARITAPSPVVGLETYRTTAGEGAGEGMETINLGLGNGIAQARKDLVFPHAVVGGGYSSQLTVVNVSGGPVDFQMVFRGMSAPVTLEPGIATEISVGSTFGMGPEDDLVTGAVRLMQVSGSAEVLLGSMDIELPTTLVGVPASTASTSIVFPHMADLGGFFTGIAVAAGSAGAEIDIEVYSPNGVLTGADTFTVPTDGEIARLVSELVEGFAPQNGGFIQLESDTPIWAWEIYGTLQAMASGPPL